MVRNSNYPTEFLGRLGEAYVILELAKQGLGAYKVHKCSFDLICSNGKRLEVKSSTMRSRGDFRFNNMDKDYKEQAGKMRLEWSTKNPNCDYYILVFFNQDNHPFQYMILPSKLMKDKSVLSLTPNAKIATGKANLMKYASYINNWTPILQ